MNGTKDTKSQTWFLTINNPTEDENKTLEMLKNSDLKSIVKYAKAAREEGEANHTPHIHLYLHLTTQERFSAIKKAFPRAKIEEPIGTPRQQIDYIGNPEYVYSEHHSDPCKRGKQKGGVCVWVNEIGDTTGLRLDRKARNTQTLDYRLQTMKDLIDAGEPTESLYEHDFAVMVRYGDRLLSYAALRDRIRARSLLQKNIEDLKIAMQEDYDDAQAILLNMNCSGEMEKEIKKAIGDKENLVKRLIDDVNRLSPEYRNRAQKENHPYDETTA